MIAFQKFQPADSELSSNNANKVYLFIFSPCRKQSLPLMEKISRRRKASTRSQMSTRPSTGQRRRTCSPPTPMGWRSRRTRICISVSFFRCALLFLYCCMMIFCFTSDIYYYPSFFWQLTIRMLRMKGSSTFPQLVVNSQLFRPSNL